VDGGLPAFYRNGRHLVTRIGQMRKRVEIWEYTVAIDASGAQSETGTKVADWWAHIEPLRGEEYTQAQQLEAGTTHRISIRYYEGLRTHHKFVFDGRTFEITSISNIDERNTYMETLCKEVQT
jgi:SPP1 family predicted phage head-tail adaptor